MEDAARLRRERLLKGELGHINTTEDYISIFKENKTEESSAEGISNRIVKETNCSFSEYLLMESGTVPLDEIAPKKSDSDLKKIWQRQKEFLDLETDKAFKSLVKQRVNPDRVLDE
jgi:hypothetical protein